MGSEEFRRQRKRLKSRDDVKSQGGLKTEEGEGWEKVFPRGTSWLFN